MEAAFSRIVYRHPSTVVMLSEEKNAARGGVSPRSFDRHSSVVDLLPKGKDTARRCFSRIVHRHPWAVVISCGALGDARRCSSGSSVVIRRSSLIHAMRWVTRGGVSPGSSIVIRRSSICYRRERTRRGGVRADRLSSSVRRRCFMRCGGRRAAVFRADRLSSSIRRPKPTTNHRKPSTNYQKESCPGLAAGRCQSTGHDPPSLITPV